MLTVDMDSDDDIRDEPGRIMGRDRHPLQKAPREKGKVWTDVAALDSHNEILEWLKKGKLKHTSGF